MSMVYYPLIVPTIGITKSGYKIQMFHDEHPPPHFHVYAQGKVYRVSISELQQLDSDTVRMPPAVRREVLQWASSRSGKLMAAWNACLAHEVPGMID